MTKLKCFFGLLAFILIPVNCVIAVPSNAKSAMPTVNDVLDKYAATQEKIFGSFVMEYEVVKDDYTSYDGILEKGRRKRGEDTIVRWDGERIYWSQKNWGNTYPPVDEYVPRDDPRHSARLWDGQRFYFWGREPDYKLKELMSKRFKTQKERDGFLFSRLYIKISPRPDIAEGKGWQVRQNYCEFPSLFGGGGPCYTRKLIKEIKNADTVSIKKQVVKGSKCYLVEASARAYSLRIFFDTESDYNICSSREVIKLPKGVTQYGIRNVKFKTINGISVPIEWDQFQQSNSQDGKISRNKNHVKRTKMIINPDHEKLKSFIPDVPNGWKVIINGFEGFKKEDSFTWKAGTFIDKNSKIYNTKNLIPKQ